MLKEAAKPENMGSSLVASTPTLSCNPVEIQLNTGESTKSMLFEESAPLIPKNVEGETTVDELPLAMENLDSSEWPVTANHKLPEPVVTAPSDLNAVELHFREAALRSILMRNARTGTRCVPKKPQSQKKADEVITEVGSDDVSNGHKRQRIHDHEAEIAVHDSSHGNMQFNGLIRPSLKDLLELADQLCAFLMDCESRRGGPEVVDDFLVKVARFVFIRSQSSFKHSI